MKNPTRWMQYMPTQAPDSESRAKRAEPMPKMVMVTSDCVGFVSGDMLEVEQVHPTFRTPMSDTYHVLRVQRSGEDWKATNVLFPIAFTMDPMAAVDAEEFLEVG